MLRDCSLLTMIMAVFSPRSLPLSPLRHQGTCLGVIVQTVPTTRCFPTAEEDSLIRDLDRTLQLRC